MPVSKGSFALPPETLFSMSNAVLYAARYTFALVVRSVYQVTTTAVV